MYVVDLLFLSYLKVMHGVSLPFIVDPISTVVELSKASRAVHLLILK